MIITSAHSTRGITESALFWLHEAKCAQSLAGFADRQTDGTYRQVGGGILNNGGTGLASSCSMSSVEPDPLQPGFGWLTSSPHRPIEC